MHRGVSRTMTGAVIRLAIATLLCGASAQDSRVLLSKCCPPGSFLHQTKWQCMKAIYVDAVTTPPPPKNVTEDGGGIYDETTVGDAVENATDVPREEAPVERRERSSGEWKFVDNNNVSTVTNESVSDLWERFSNGRRFTWLPPGFMTDTFANSSDQLVLYSTIKRLNCSYGSGMRVDSGHSHRYNLSRDDGTFVLRARRPGNGTKEMEFSAEEVCVDNALGFAGAVFLLCPCGGDMHCVSKCCGHRQSAVCNAVDQNCICSDDEDDVPDWDPIANEGFLPPEDFSYDILEDNIPQCGEGQELLRMEHFNPHHTSKFWIGYPKGSNYSEERVCGDSVAARDGARFYFLMLCVDSGVFDVDAWPALLFGPQIPAALLLACALAVTLATRQPALSPFGAVHAVALPSHAAALLVLNATRAALVFVRQRYFCPTFAFVVHFCLMASAFWLNVICVNMAWGFGRPCGARTGGRSRSRLPLLYSAYAWGCSVAMTAVVAGLWYSPSASARVMRPSLVETRTCYGEFMDSPGKLSTFAYYYGPMGLLLLVNVALCGLTMWRIREAKRQTSVLYKKDNKTSKESSVMDSVLVYVKLLSLMGVLEIAVEMVAWASSLSYRQEFYFGACASFIDLARAASVFALCVCSRRTLKRLRQVVAGAWLQVQRSLRLPSARRRPDPPRTAASDTTLTSAGLHTLSTSGTVSTDCG